MTNRKAKRQSISFDPDVVRLVEANQGRESFSETVNRLVRAAGTIETERQILNRLKDLCERSLAMMNVAHEALASTGERQTPDKIEESRVAYLNGIKGEKWC